MPAYSLNWVLYNGILLNFVHDNYVIVNNNGLDAINIYG